MGLNEFISFFMKLSHNNQMSSNRRAFFKKLVLGATCVAALPRILSSLNSTAVAGVTGASAVVATGPYKVFYTFTANSLAEANVFHQLIKTSTDIRSHNKNLREQGHIISRSEFYALDENTMRSEIIFKSKESYDLFLASSKSVSSELMDFKKKNNIQIAIEPVV